MIGIPPEKLDMIFDSFTQVDGSYTRKYSGTGLGLSMSYDIVTKGHGGELKVDSKVGPGTEFIIIIPVEWEW